jgi:hypothetical protein
MDGPAFDAFLNEAGDTHYLTGSVVVYGNNRGLVAADWATAADVINNVNIVDNARNRLQAAIRREPIELIKYIVKNDRPFTEAVNGKYTVANGVMAQYLGPPCRDRSPTPPTTTSGVRRRCRASAWAVSASTPA